MTSTQRLAGETCDAFLVPLGELVAVALAVALAGIALRVRVGAGLAAGVFRAVVGAALPEALRVLVAVGDVGAALGDVGAFTALMVFVSFVGATTGLEVSVRVGAGVAADRVVADGMARGEDVPAAVAVAVVGDGVVGVWVGVGVAVGV